MGHTAIRISAGRAAALTGNTREKSGVQSSQQEDGSPVLLKNHTQGVPNDEKR